MDTPAQITFHQMASSETLDEEARQGLANLDAVHGHIVRGRVVFEAPAHHERKAVRVGVEVAVSGKHFAVNREADDPAQETVVGALRDAFAAVKRELEDHQRSQRGAVKARVVPPHGRVSFLDPAGDFGRLETADGRDIYFHRNSVLGGFERLDLGDEVRFHEEAGLKGPQASTVELVGRQGHHFLPDRTA